MEINVCTMYEPVTFISRWVYLQWEVNAAKKRSYAHSHNAKSSNYINGAQHGHKKFRS